MVQDLSCRADIILTITGFHYVTKKFINILIKTNKKWKTMGFLVSPAEFHYFKAFLSHNMGNSFYMSENIIFVHRDYSPWIMASEGQHCF